MMLTSHSKISIPPETWFLLDLVDVLPLMDVLSPAQVELALTKILSHYRWPDLEIDRDAYMARARALHAPTVRALTDLIYGTITDREGKQCWGDKTPPYVKIIPQLAELYPEARFVHLFRDGRDVAQSFYERRWGGRWLLWNTKEWAESVDMVQLHRERLDSSRLLEISYEDLVIAPETTVIRLCNFLGVEPEAGMLEWADSVHDKIPDRELHIHRKLFRAPRPTDTGRWEREHSALQTLILEAHLGDRLSRLGYRTRFHGKAIAILFPVVRMGCKVLLPTIDWVLRGLGWVKRRLFAARGREGALPQSE
jgi:hypothetical protein